MRDAQRARALLAGALAVAMLLVSATTVTAVAGEKPKDDHLSKLPPLIERDVLFGDPTISGAQISPDGKWISFRKPYRDVMNIWVKAIDQKFEEARPITADTERPVRGYFWTEDSRFVLYAQDKGGDENFHIYKVDPKGKATGEAKVPQASDLTPVENVRAMIYAVPEKTPSQIIIGLNDRDAAAHDVYRLDINTGKREPLVRNESNVAGWATDLNGNVRLAVRQTADGGTETLEVKDGELGRVLYACNFEESCGPVRFHKDGKRVYMVSNKGKDIDLARLMLMNVATGETTLVEADPEKQVDFGGPIFSDKTEELIGTVYVGDRVRIYARDERLAKELAFLRKKLPDGELGFGSGTEDERFAIVSVGQDVNPGAVYLFDRQKMKLEKLYDSRPELPTKHLSSMKAVRYKARDGVEIPAYLTIPKGTKGKNLPAIILPHGGPWARDNWGFDSFAQFLANRGYAVLQPNFRGSTGYGKAFLNAGNGEWGTGIMQHDLTDGVAYLVDSGIADPKRVAIMGGSYGGYATLAGMTFTPDVYAAGVSIVGPSNIITLMDSIPPYWGPIKKMFHTRVGDPDVPEDRARLEAQSPFNHAKQIKAPLLVIQGANDPRVKKTESDQIVVALRELERPVEYIVAPDEGHGFAGEENRIAMFAAIEEFLSRQLGGRHQEGAAPEIEEKLASLRVDIGTVKMPQVASGLEMARTSTLPIPRSDDLKPATLRYTSDLKLAAGQELKLKNTRELRADTLEERAVWRVESSTETPQGTVADVFYLDRKSLAPVRRVVKQGPVDVRIDYEDESITGLMKLPNQEIPIDVSLDAPVFADSEALEATIAALPLADGYETTIRTFDVQQQKVRIWKFSVVGIESVEVPAGSFEAFKAAMTPLDGNGGGGSLWFTQAAPRKLVRSEYELPPLTGGGTITTVLEAMPAE